jgi:hypothetical protein
MNTITRKYENSETQLPRAVAEIHKIHFQGNVTPHEWYNHIKLPSGKTDLIAITILGEIIYWYRPIEILQTEGKDQKVKLRKKFTHDMFHCTAAYFVKKFGLTSHQARDALKRLEDGGYIRREYRDPTTPQGLQLNNIMFIEPIHSKIIEITHPLLTSPLSDTADTPSVLSETPSVLSETPSVLSDHTKITTKTSTKTTTTTPTPPPSNSGEPLSTECGSGSSELIYPKELLSEEREEAARILKAVNGQAQQLLDELAGQLKAKEIKNPLGYLHGLTAKAKEGKFSATAGIKVREIRKQRARIEASIKASEERASKPLEGPRREERWGQLDKLRKLRESLGSTAHP